MFQVSCDISVYEMCARACVRQLLLPCVCVCARVRKQEEGAAGGSHVRVLSWCSMDLF